MAEQRNQTPAGDNTQWTTVIRPRTGWFDVDLEELWRYRDLIVMFVKRNFTVMYKQTILGPLWIILNPLITTVLFNVVFGGIAGLSTDGTPSFLFYMAGNTVWTFFASCINGTANTFVANSQVFGKVYFPRLIMPLSIVASALMKFAVQFGIFLVIWGYYLLFTESIQPNIWMLATPFLVLLMAMFALGVGMIFSSLTTKYKDLSFLLTFGVQLFMYITPVVYPISALPEKFRFLADFNPLSPVFECLRYAFLGTGTFTVMSLAWSTAVIVVILAVGTVIFNRVEKSFMDTV